MSDCSDPCARVEPRQVLPRLFGRNEPQPQDVVAVHMRAHLGLAIDKGQHQICLAAGFAQRVRAGQALERYQAHLVVRGEGGADLFDIIASGALEYAHKDDAQPVAASGQLRLRIDHRDQRQR